MTAPRCSKTSAMMPKALGLSVLLGVALYIPSGSPTEKNTPVSVTATPVVYKTQAKAIHTSGRLEYKSVQRLSFKTGGPVSAIHVDEGEAITVGQLLAELDTEETDAQLAEAEARYINAKDSLKRLQHLRKNMVSIEQVQTAETARDVAASRLKIARFNQRYSKITAPSSGHIVKRFIEPSEFVSPNQTAFELADESKGWVIRTGLSDRDIVRVRPGDQATIRFDAWPGSLFSGEITSIAPSASVNTGTFDIEVSLDITARRLYQGLIGRITIMPGQKNTVAYLPLSSLIASHNGLATVFTINPESNQVRPAQIRLLYLENSQAVISGHTLKPLPEGTQVVTRGASFLKPGDAVRITNKATDEE